MAAFLIPAILATVAVAGTAMQIDAAKSQKRAQRRAEARQIEANKISEARANVDRAIKRRRAIMQARQVQAANQAAAQAQGAGLDSSAVQGANAALMTNLGSNIASERRSFRSGSSAFDLRQGAAFDVNRTSAAAGLKSVYGSTLTNAATFALGQMNFSQPASTSGPSAPVQQGSPAGRHAPYWFDTGAPSPTFGF